MGYMNNWVDIGILIFSHITEFSSNLHFYPNGLYLLMLEEIEPTIIAVYAHLSLLTSGGGDGNHLHTHLPSFTKQEYIQHGTKL